METWKYASPEWSDKREAFLRGQWENIEQSSWLREYLNLWVPRANHWLKDSWWKETLSDEPLPPAATWSVAVESDFDGMGHAVAIAAPMPSLAPVTNATLPVSRRSTPRYQTCPAGGSSQFTVPISPR